MRSKIGLGLLVLGCIGAAGCTRTTPSGLASNAAAGGTPMGPLQPLVPPAFSDVEAWCAREIERPFVPCVAATAALVLGSPLVLANPTWVRSGAFAAGCKEAKSGVVCLEGARVVCTDGLVTDVIACASMGMVCSPGPSGGECVRSACAAGARVQCHDGLLDSCNESHSETTRHRCPSSAPCRDDGAGGFTCTLPGACGETTCENGVAKVCVGGEPRAVQCQQAGWGCPAQGLPGLPPAPCSLPAVGETCAGDQATCEGAKLRYCLNGHARTFDCAATSQDCRESAEVGAHCE